MTDARPTPMRTFAPGPAGWLVTVAVAAAGVVAHVLYSVLVDPNLIEPSDADTFRRLGRQLADGLGYVRPIDPGHPAHPTAEFPPVLPAMLAALFEIGIDSIRNQRIALAILAAPLTGGAAVLAGHVGGRRLAIVVGGLTVVHPALVQLTSTLMTEAIAAPLAVAAVAASLWLQRARALGPALVLGLLGGVGALVRSELIVLTVALAILAVLPRWRPDGAGHHHESNAAPRSDRTDVAPVVDRVGAASPPADPAAPAPPGVDQPGSSAAAEDSVAWARTGSRAHAATLLAVVALGMLPVPAAWAARNLATFEEPVLVSNNLGTLLAGSNCDRTWNGPLTGYWVIDPECSTGYPSDALRDADESELSAELRSEGLDHLRANLRDAPRVAAVRVLRTFHLWEPEQQVRLATFEGRDRRFERLSAWVMWATLPLAAVGTWTLRRRRPAVAALLVAPVFVVVVLAALTYGNPRFRVVAEVPLLILAVVGAQAFLGRERRRRRVS